MKKKNIMGVIRQDEAAAALLLFGSKNSSWKGRELGEREADKVTLPLCASVSPSVKIG